MNWITRWRYEVAEKPVRPGIWRLRIGYIVSTQVTDGRRTIQRVLKAANLEEATSAFAELRREARHRLSGARLSTELFCDVAVELRDRKVRAGDIKSAKGEEKWRTALSITSSRRSDTSSVAKFDTHT